MKRFNRGDKMTYDESEKLNHSARLSGDSESHFTAKNTAIQHIKQNTAHTAIFEEHPNGSSLRLFFRTLFSSFF